MFSELVDDIISELKQHGDQTRVVRALNSTIRESQTLRDFHRDLVEDSVLANADPYIWNYPSEFRKMRAVRYYNGTAPKMLLPGKIQHGETNYYYAGAGYFAFKGNGTNMYISVAYYRYLPRLAYFAAAVRPAVYDDATQTWDYLTAVTEADQEFARSLVTNWLIEHWRDMLMEGVFAKVLKMADDKRASASYGVYKQQQDLMMKSEVFEGLGR